MNGRLERMDCIELNCEENYSTVDFFVAENQRRKKLRRKIEGWLAFAAFVGYMWLIIWGGVGR